VKIAVRGEAEAKMVAKGRRNMTGLLE